MTESANILLIRHAHIACSDGPRALLCGRYDAGLSPLGRQQVEMLRSKLLDQGPLSAVYSSSLRRALETACAAPSEIRHTLRPLKSLREIYCGVVDGLPIERVQKEFADAWRRNKAQDDENFGWPGGESYKHFRHRVLRVLRIIAERHQGERVLVFTHAGVINQLIGSIQDQTPARWENYRPPNASITEVQWDREGGPRLVRFAGRSHLLPANSHLHA